jgi:hypothetical protein
VSNLKIDRQRLLRVLARFDVATVEDVAGSFGGGLTAKRRTWAALNAAVVDGQATREGNRGQVARYQITDAGRAELAQPQAEALNDNRRRKSA